MPGLGTYETSQVRAPESSIILGISIIARWLYVGLITLSRLWCVVVNYILYFISVVMYSYTGLITLSPCTHRWCYLRLWRVVCTTLPSPFTRYPRLGSFALEVLTLGLRMMILTSQSPVAQTTIMELCNLKYVHICHYGKKCQAIWSMCNNYTV